MSSARYNCEEYAREQWGPIVSRLNEEKRTLQAQIEKLEKENANLRNYESESNNFRKLMKAIKDEPVAQSYWNKVLLCLRITE